MYALMASTTSSRIKPGINHTLSTESHLNRIKTMVQQVVNSTGTDDCQPINQADIETTLSRLANDILPEFSK